MKRDRDLAIELIQDKLNGKISLTYSDIAILSGFHPKYILNLKKQIDEKSIHLEHGNRNRKPSNALSKEEEEKIISLYKRANATIKEFARFYGRRSYSCIYNVLKRNGLL